MKAIILAGGYGTRISEETVTKPKPMIEMVVNLYAHNENILHVELTNL